MKIETALVKSQKLFELYFIKMGVHKKSLKKINRKHLSSKDLTTVMIQFKKALQIIFKYHKHCKKIRFIGAPQSLENKINFSSPHTAIPASFSSKKHVQLPNVLKNENFLLPLKLNQKPDLIVFFENNNISSSSLKESFAAKTPTIVLNYEVLEHFQRPSYVVYGNIRVESKSILNKLFLTILNATLGRSKKENASDKKKK